MPTIDAVADTRRCSWEEATDLPVMEFLNTIGYRAAKNKAIEDAARRR